MSDDSSREFVLGADADIDMLSEAVQHLGEDVGVDRMVDSAAARLETEAEDALMGEFTVRMTITDESAPHFLLFMQALTGGSEVSVVSDDV